MVNEFVAEYFFATLWPPKIYKLVIEAIEQANKAIVFSPLAISRYNPADKIRKFKNSKKVIIATSGLIKFFKRVLWNVLSK